MPSEQRAEDGLSLCFDSAALDAPMETLGFPDVTLTLAVDRPLALLAVRLCDVSPAGSSTLISWGLLNLTHRGPHGHEHPARLEPGKRYTVTVRINAIGHRLPAGHRWRVAVSPTYWRHAWPSPEPVTLRVFTGAGCSLDLPVRTPRPEDATLRAFGPPETSAPLDVEMLRPESRKRLLRRENARRPGLVELLDHYDDGCFRLNGSGLEYGSDATDTYAIVEGDPLSAYLRCERSITFERKREACRIRVEATSVMTSDAQTFRLTNVLDAYEGNTRVFSQTWTSTVSRDLV